MESAPLIGPEPNQTPSTLRSTISNLPELPGVYLMRDASHKIIYVGKAKNLKKRVSSYFQKTNMGGKIHALLDALRHIDYVACASEREALVLEEAWIKKFQPIFNAMWKDGKSYPYAVLTLGEDFPRLYLTRKQRIPPGARAFGPYPNVNRIKNLIRMLFRTSRIPLRPCQWNFSLKNPLDPKKINSCLYYHTLQCPAPCAGRITRDSYQRIALKAAHLFAGNRGRQISALRREMKQASRRLDFETAQKLKMEIEALEHMKEKLMIRELSVSELGLLSDVKIGLERLKTNLKLTKIPRHIEGFDISNLQGTNSVASSVCFMDGQPNKNHYRHYRIKWTTGIDDYAMIKEAVARRLARLISEKGILPDIFLIDGGSGQLAAARRALEEEGKSERGPVLLSLAKREETLYLDLGSRRAKEIRLPKSDEGLKLCMWIRDEAHRFAINYHRKRRKLTLGH